MASNSPRQFQQIAGWVSGVVVAAIVVMANSPADALTPPLLESREREWQRALAGV
jgi:hypothetical protein